MVDFRKAPGMYLGPHPLPVTKERPIPVELWPDQPKVLKASVEEWENTLASWKEFWKLAERFPLVSVDTETTGLKPHHGSRIVGVAASFFDGKAIQAGYWNFRHMGHPRHRWCSAHDETTSKATRKKCFNANVARWEGLTQNIVDDCLLAWCPGYVEKANALDPKHLALVEPVFLKCLVGGQNFKYDCNMFSVDGVGVPRRVLDTGLIAHLWNEAKSYKRNLDSLASEMGEKKLGDSVKEYMELHSLSVEESGHGRVPYEVERKYAIEDSVIVLRRLQWERNRWKELDDPKMMEAFQIENACVPAIAQMEINGMKLDMEYVRYGVERLEREMEDLSKTIYRMAGKEFDITSNEQLWKILEARGLKPVAYTPAGDPQVDATALEAYAAQGEELAQPVLDYRAAQKTHGTYLKPYLDRHADPRGFIHGDFRIDGTVSGRLSMADPNLENLPRPEIFTARNTMRGATAKMIQQGVDKFANLGSEKVQVRRAFVPPGPDYSMFFPDYSQMELRVFAEYADERYILDGLEREGVDIHELVAREIFPNFPEKDENPDLYAFFRQLTKQINFGIIYGMGKNKLALQLSVPVDETVRWLLLAKTARKEGRAEGKSACTLSDEQIDSYLEDHRVMTKTRQWQGLKALAKEVAHYVDPEPLERALFVGNEHLGLRYSADSFLKKYHDRFPKIKALMKGIDQAVRARGWLFNKYGRRYHLDPEKSYVGLNRIVQGSCADMVKVGMHRCHVLLRGTKSMMVNQVHDEVVFYIHHSELDLVPKIHEAMEYFPNLAVKMQVELKYSHTNWAEKRKWSSREEFEASLKELRGSTEAKAKRGPARKVAKAKPVVQQPARRKAKV